MVWNFSSPKTLLEKTAVGGPKKPSESACISLHFIAENINTFYMVCCFADKNTQATYVVSNKSEGRQMESWVLFMKSNTEISSLYEFSAP